jgi:hypothetical protein
MESQLKDAILKEAKQPVWLSDLLEKLGLTFPYAIEVANLLSVVYGLIQQGLMQFLPDERLQTI